MQNPKYILHNILMDIGLCTNADFGYGSFGEFEHNRPKRAYKLAGFATFVVLIVYLIRQK